MIHWFSSLKYSLKKLQSVSNLLSHLIHNLIKSFFVVDNESTFSIFSFKHHTLQLLVHLWYSSFFNSNKSFLYLISSHFFICFWCFNIILLWTVFRLNQSFMSFLFSLTLFFIVCFLSKTFPIFQPIWHWFYRSNLNVLEAMAKSRWFVPLKNEVHIACTVQ